MLRHVVKFWGSLHIYCFISSFGIRMSQLQCPQWMNICSDCVVYGSLSLKLQINKLSRIIIWSQQKGVLTCNFETGRCIKIHLSFCPLVVCRQCWNITGSLQLVSFCVHFRLLECSGEGWVRCLSSQTHKNLLACWILEIWAKTKMLTVQRSSGTFPLKGQPVLISL